MEIAGLVELREALGAERQYAAALQVLRQGIPLTELPRLPATSAAELARRYPGAAAWLQAEHWSGSVYPPQAAAGRRALERLLAGEAPEAVLDAMKAEWVASLEQILCRKGTDDASLL